MADAILADVASALFSFLFVDTEIAHTLSQWHLYSFGIEGL